MATVPPASGSVSDSQLNELPELSFDVLTSNADIRDALKLIADSVAQQSQEASRVLIFHPACLSSLVIALLATYALTASYGSGDVGTMVIICAGVLLSYLTAIRYSTSSYIHLAETTDWLGWLRNPHREENDTILGARFGRDIIGVVVLRFESQAGSEPGSRAGRTALIRAWTTKMKYRHRGLGRDMLLEAVKLARHKLGDDATIKMASNHANSTDLQNRLLKSYFLEKRTKLDLVVSSVLQDTTRLRKTE